MKGVSAGLKVGATAIVIAIIGFVSFKFVAKGLRGEEGFAVWALFRDATGLVDKSRVQVAGLNIGEIKERRLQGSYARVTIRVRPDAELWSNASIYKKSASLLGEFYLELDPGTKFTPDPLTGQAKENYLLKDCKRVTGKDDCNQITNVVEAVTAGDIMVQVNETLPVLRDILTDVRHLTQGPLQDIAKQVQTEITRNADAVARVLDHVDQIATDVRTFTHGDANDDLRAAMKNVREITDGVKQIVGAGEGQVNTTSDKIKRDLDKFAETLEKVNQSLDKVTRITDDVADVTGRVNKGEGTIGRLLHDDAIAENVTNITEDAGSFIRSLTKLQTIVGVHEEWMLMSSSFKTYFSIQLMPRPDKYYLIELVDDPRGSKTYTHTFTNTTGGDARLQGNVNTDTWSRSSAFRVSFMFAKRVEPWGAFGLTGRIGIKESTGGVGLDLDFWQRRLMLQVDLFDMVSETWPRLKVLAALRLFEHVWLLGGVDDILNGSDQAATDLRTAHAGSGRADITCGPATPQSWCHGGRDYFIGARLTFNDEDLRALLAVGAGALGGAAGGK